MTESWPFQLPTCEGCSAKVIGLVDGQPSHLCMTCFYAELGDAKWLFTQIKKLVPQIKTSQQRRLIKLIQEEMCKGCYGPSKPTCFCQNDE